MEIRADRVRAAGAQLRVLRTLLGAFGAAHGVFVSGLIWATRHAGAPFDDSLAGIVSGGVAYAGVHAM